MCTQESHDRAPWSSLLNPRPWPGIGLEIAECPKCMSTLAREVEPITVAIPKQSLAECAAEWRRELAEQGLVGGAS